MPEQHSSGLTQSSAALHHACSSLNGASRPSSHPDSDASLSAGPDKAVPASEYANADIDADTKYSPLPRDDESPAVDYGQVAGKTSQMSWHMMDAKRLRKIRKELHCIAKLLDAVLLQRYQLEHEQSTLDSSQDLLYQNIDHLLDEHQDESGQHNVDEAEALRKRDKRVKLDLKALRVQTQRVKALRGTLNGLEYQLRPKEEDLKNAIEQYEHCLQENPDVVSDLSSDGSSDDGTASDQSEVPSLLERYHDQRGNVSIIHERLGDFEDDYQEARLRREIFADRGDSVEGSDEDFERNYARQREMFLRDLKLAEQRAAILRDECLLAKISVPDLPRLTQESFSDWNLGETTNDTEEGLAADLDAAILRSPDHDRHIGDWVGGINSPLLAEPPPIVSQKSSIAQTPVTPSQQSSSPFAPTQCSTSVREPDEVSPLNRLKVIPQDTTTSEVSVKSESVWSVEGLGLVPRTRRSSWRSTKSFPKLSDLEVQVYDFLRGASAVRAEQEKPLYTFEVQEQKYFRVGRVIMTPWTDIMRETNGGHTGAVDVKDRLADSGVSGISFESRGCVRRFVIISTSSHYCNVLPIMHYGRKGVGRSGVVKSEHSIIYTGKGVPKPAQSEQPMSAEEPMLPLPIRVVPNDPTDKLDAMSRLDYARLQTVSYNSRIKPFGMVHENSLAAMEWQFRALWLDKVSRRPSVESDNDDVVYSEVTYEPVTLSQKQMQDQADRARSQLQVLLREGYTRKRALDRMFQQLLGAGYTEQNGRAILDDAKRGLPGKTK